MGRQIGRRAVRKPNRSGSPRSAEQLANEPMRYPTVSSMAWRPGELRSASIPDLKITTSTHRLEREQQRLVVQRLVTDGDFERLSERGRIASSKSERAEVREMARLGHPVTPTSVIVDRELRTSSIKRQSVIRSP